MCMCGDCSGGVGGRGSLVPAFIWSPRLLESLPSSIHGFSILGNQREQRACWRARRKLQLSALEVAHITLFTLHYFDCNLVLLLHPTAIKTEMVVFARCPGEKLKKRFC